MNYIIAVEGSQAFNIETKLTDYTMKIIVSEDVYRWMEQHDVEYTDQRARVFIYNNLRYVDLGPDIEGNETIIPMGEPGKA